VFEERNDWALMDGNLSVYFESAFGMLKYIFVVISRHLFCLFFHGSNHFKF
jgi:hypothetical protein